MRVRCQGRMHTIEFTRRGRLVLLDHPKGRGVSDSVMNELGLENRCQKLLEKWQRYFRNNRGYAGEKAAIPSHWGLEDPLASAAATLRKKQRSRVRQRTCTCRSPQRVLADFSYGPYPRSHIQGKGPIVRSKLLFQKLASELFTECRCPDGKSRYRRAEYHTMDADLTDTPRAKATIRYFRDGWRGRRYQCKDISLGAHAYWYIRVYKKGLAVVDGYLVLDIPSPGQYLVAAPFRRYGLRSVLMRMGRGGHLRPIPKHRKEEVKREEEHSVPCL